MALAGGTVKGGLNTRVFPRSGLRGHVLEGA
jgi:hypothetical protein